MAMFTGKSAIRAIEAKHAENLANIGRAQKTADEATSLIRKHMDDCNTRAVEAATWRATTTGTLTRQNDQLDAIKSAARWAFRSSMALFLTIIGGLIVALAVVVYDIIKRGGHL